MMIAEHPSYHWLYYRISEIEYSLPVSTDLNTISIVSFSQYRYQKNHQIER